MTHSHRPKLYLRERRDGFWMFIIRNLMETCSHVKFDEDSNTAYSVYHVIIVWQIEFVHQAFHINSFQIWNEPKGLFFARFARLGYQKYRWIPAGFSCERFHNSRFVHVVNKIVYHVLLLINDSVVTFNDFRVLLIKTFRDFLKLWDKKRIRNTTNSF